MDDEELDKKMASLGASFAKAIRSLIESVMREAIDHGPSADKDTKAPTSDLAFPTQGEANLTGRVFRGPEIEPDRREDVIAPDLPPAMRPPSSIIMPPAKDPMPPGVMASAPAIRAAEFTAIAPPSAPSIPDTPRTEPREPLSFNTLEPPHREGMESPPAQPVDKRPWYRSIVTPPVTPEPPLPDLPLAVPHAPLSPHVFADGAPPGSDPSPMAVSRPALDVPRREAPLTTTASDTSPVAISRPSLDVPRREAQPALPSSDEPPPATSMPSLDVPRRETQPIPPGSDAPPAGVSRPALDVPQRGTSSTPPDLNYQYSVVKPPQLDPRPAAPTVTSEPFRHGSEQSAASLEAPSRPPPAQSQSDELWISPQGESYLSSPSRSPPSRLPPLNAPMGESSTIEIRRGFSADDPSGRGALYQDQRAKQLAESQRDDSLDALYQIELLKSHTEHHFRRRMHALQTRNLYDLNNDYRRLEDLERRNETSRETVTDTNV